MRLRQSKTPGDEACVQATKEVSEAEKAMGAQSQSIKELEKHESEILDKHRTVGTQRAKLERELHQVTEDAQASRYFVFSRERTTYSDWMQQTAAACYVSSVCASLQEDGC